jgi:hypothetical protein
MNLEETCYVCGNRISSHDKIAVVRERFEEAGEKRAHVDCCPILYVDERDLVFDVQDILLSDPPHRRHKCEELIHPQNVEVSILQYGNHHIGVVLSARDEVLRNQDPNTSTSVALDHIIDRNGQRITISLTDYYEKYLKTKGIFDKGAID